MNAGAGGAPPSIDGFTDLVKIGQGGFSTVYSATQEGIDRRVAIKVLDLGFSDEHRFRRECRTLGSLSGVHGIVPVLQATFSRTGQPCIVMHLMDGGSLAQRVRSKGPLSPIDVVRNGTVLCQALQNAHDQRVFHRDIKPENVLFNGNDAAIADFGIALVDDMESRSQTMDSISPPHAPPERFADGRADPVLGDVYSLGSTLYTALAGRPPFGTVADGGLAGLIQRVTASPVPPLDRSDVPAGVAEVLARAMAKNPLDRYQSMSSFGAALQASSSDDRTVRRAPAAAPVAAPPGPMVPDYPPPTTPPVAGATILRGATPTHPPPGHSSTGPPPPGEPTLVGAAPPRRRGIVVLWSVAAALLVVALAGGAFLIGQRMTKWDPVASDQSTTTERPTTTPTTVTTTTTTTVAVTPVTPAPPAAAPPTTAAIPSTTTSTALPPGTESDATNAVIQYLDAASGFDVDAFAERWAFPIELQYTKTNVSEDELRESAVRYFASKNDLAFEPVGPTSVVASSRGWETTTPYRAEQWPVDGAYKCEIVTIRLGFDTSWRVRTATEDGQRSC